MRLVMKMAAVSAICLFLLCCSAISSADSQEVCNVVGERGKSVILPLVNVWGKSESLRWTYKNELIYYKKANVVYVDKKGDVSANGSLQLTKVDEGDVGVYTPEIHDENGRKKGALLPISLCVLDGPPSPKLSFKCNVPSVTFTCGVQAQLAKDLSFEWLQNNKVLPKEKSQTLKQTANQVETSSFSCKVSNRAGSAISASVKHNCVTPKIFFPEKLLGINTWIFVGAGGGVVLVLIIIVVVCCICAKRKKSMRLKDEGELRLAWTSEAQQHQQQQSHPPDQHHHLQKQPAGHTGPRQPRTKQHRDQRRPRAPGDPGAHPQPSPRRPAQAPRPPGKFDEEQPPPLPQPRKAGKIQRV